MGENDQGEDVSHDSEQEPGPRETADDATQSDAGLTGSPSFAATGGPAAAVAGDFETEDVLGDGDDEDDEGGDQDDENADRGDEAT